MPQITVFEDAYFLVVNKPAGVASEQLCASMHPTLLQVNRLDQRVSGLMVLAKSANVQTRLSQIWNSSRVLKKYLAVVANAPASNQGSLEHWLIHNKIKHKATVVASEVNGAKLAKLQFRLLQQTQRYFLLEMILKSGRFHQIRAQLSASGMPIVGDVKYGYPRTTPDGSIFLQSYSLQFPHPFSGQMVHCFIPMPLLWHKYGFVNE